MRQREGIPYPLGVSLGDSYANFAVDVPQGKQCELLLYLKGKKVPEYEITMELQPLAGQIRAIQILDLDWSKYEYNYRVDGHVMLDPYAKELVGRGKFGDDVDLDLHQVRGKISLPSFDWQDDHRPNLGHHEVVAYSLHVRGFTKDSSSGVEHPGTFLGVIEKIPYLLELGINQIQCMPIYEFEEFNGRYHNYWGYGTGCYFAPKSTYAATSSASTECKEMIRACHKAGIEVVFEMPFAQDVLPQIALACLHYYQLEYHVDGFVVNPYTLPWEMLQKDPYLRGVKILKKDDAFQNVMRRFLKGDEGMVKDVMWAVRHHTASDCACNYMTTHTGFTLRDLVSYDGKHNEANGERNQDGPDYNYSWNCGVEGPTRKKAVLELRRQQVYNAFFLLLMAQGTPCILAGDEFGNSQNGNNNVYCQDNELSWLNWNKLKNSEELFQYVKGLIALRKRYCALHKDATLLGMDRMACGIPDVSYHGENAWVVPDEIASRQLGVLYHGGEGKQAHCFLAYNMHWLKHQFAIPTLDKSKVWKKVWDTTVEETDASKFSPDQRSIELKPRSCVLLVQEERKEVKRDRKHAVERVGE